MLRPANPQSSLISMDEAAAMLGMSVHGLRKVVNRSRAKANGHNVRGSTIRFVQPSKGSLIQFRPQWIEDFIDAHTIDPETARAKLRKTPAKIVLKNDHGW